jgi:alpha-galactosidase
VLWTEIGYPDHLKAKVRDIWQKKDLGSSSGAYAADVPSHGVVMLKIVP